LNGANYIPPHHDKAVSKALSPKVEDGSAIFNFVMCEDGAERPFRLVGDDGRVVREWITTHGSLVRLTPEDNARFKHTVPRDPSVKGLRISVVFREATRYKLDRRPAGCMSGASTSANTCSRGSQSPSSYRIR